MPWSVSPRAVSQDFRPFCGGRATAGSARFNVVGLRLRDFTAARIAAVNQMHRLLYREGRTLEEARAAIDALAQATPRGGPGRRADERLPRAGHARLAR